MAPTKPALLKPDALRVTGQRFCLVSFIGPDACLRQKHEKLGMKISGAFGTLEEAREHAAKLMEMDGLVDIYVLEMNQWAVIPPDPACIEDVEYRDKMLNDLMRGHVDNQRKAKAYFEQRKNAILVDGLDQHLEPSERLALPAAQASDDSRPQAL